MDDLRPRWVEKEDERMIKEHKVEIPEEYKNGTLE